MTRTVKTSIIEKKFTNKTTGKEQTISINYAKVIDRLNAFRSDYPRSKVLTQSKTVDGVITFKAFIWKDKDELLEILKQGVDKEAIYYTADSEGTAQKEVNKSEKNFEKLETIAVGRALALLGYAVSGEIASTEEMEEFEDYKAQKYQEDVEQAIELLNGAATIDDLRKVFVSIERKIREEPNVIITKNKCKEKLTKKVPVKKEQNDENNQDPTK